MELIKIWLAIFLGFCGLMGIVLLGIFINQHFNNDLWTALYLFFVFSGFFAVIFWDDVR